VSLVVLPVHFVRGVRSVVDVIVRQPDDVLVEVHEFGFRKLTGVAIRFHGLEARHEQGARVRGRFVQGPMLGGVVGPRPRIFAIEPIIRLRGGSEEKSNPK
jgi:hypothetical protein